MTAPTPVADVDLDQQLQNVLAQAIEHFFFVSNPLAVEDVDLDQQLNNLTNDLITIGSLMGETVLAVGTTAVSGIDLDRIMQNICLYVGWTDYFVTIGETISPNATLTPNLTTANPSVTLRDLTTVSLSTETRTDDGSGGVPVSSEYIPLAHGNYRLFADSDYAFNVVLFDQVVLGGSGVGPTILPFTVDTPAFDGFVEGIGFFVDEGSPVDVSASMCIQYLGATGTVFEPTA